jgi:hypothetical protein
MLATLTLGSNLSDASSDNPFGKGTNKSIATPYAEGPCREGKTAFNNRFRQGTNSSGTTYEKDPWTEGK